MTKEQAIERLKALGFTLAEDAAIVTVLVDSDSDYKAAIKEVTNTLSDMGYEASFSVKMHDTPGGSMSKTKEEKPKVQEEADDEFFDEEDSDMLLDKDSVQFSLEDFGLYF